MDPEVVGPASQAGPEELAERCLRSHSYPPLKNISCTYHNGLLVLRGRVETYYYKQVAQAAVAGLEGVERIDNQIEVVAPGSKRD